MRAILIALMLCGISLAEDQITVKKAVTGLGEYEAVGDVLLLNEDAEPTFGYVAHLVLDGEFDAALVKAGDSDRERFNVDKEGDRSWVIHGTGEVWVEAVLMTLDPPDLAERRFEIVIPELNDGDDDDEDEDDGEPDEPDKLVPEDEFDNIGRRVQKATIGKPHNDQLEAAYADAAITLRIDPSATINSVTQQISNVLSQIPQYNTTYTSVRTLLNADIEERWPMARGVLADYWDAVATGYGGVE